MRKTPILFALLAGLAVMAEAHPALGSNHRECKPDAARSKDIADAFPQGIWTVYGESNHPLGQGSCEAAKAVAIAKWIKTIEALYGSGWADVAKAASKSAKCEIYTEHDCVEPDIGCPHTVYQVWFHAVPCRPPRTTRHKPPVTKLDDRLPTPGPLPKARAPEDAARLPTAPSSGPAAGRPAPPAAAPRAPSPRR